MRIKNRLYNNTLYIMLCGELDEYSAGYTRTIVDNLLDNEKPYRQVIFDSSELEFMDSTGIGVLIGRYKKLKNKNITIYICNPSSHVEKIFKMSGLYEIMPKIS